MQVVYSDDELLHNPLNEMTGGEWKPYVGKSFLTCTWNKYNKLISFFYKKKKKNRVS